jgi:hypothetical protein
LPSEIKSKKSEHGWTQPQGVRLRKVENGNMKMKTSIQGTVLTAACLLLASSNQTHAIEGLELSLQCSNVVLSWPCKNDGSESFIVQYRRTLDPSTPWQTLTSSLNAQYGSSVTYFVHENVVTNADCGGDSLLGMESRDSLTRELTYFDWGVPLATPADGTGVLCRSPFTRRALISPISLFLIRRFLIG